MIKYQPLSKPKPVRTEERKPLSIYRPPLDGPVTPRLQKVNLQSAIGFHVSLPPQRED
jgi:hypothetical protein